MIDFRLAWTLLDLGKSVEAWGIAEVTFVGREPLVVGRDNLCKLFEHARAIRHPDVSKGMGQP